MAKSNKSWLQRFRQSESSTSVIFGAIVVVIVGILLFNYSRSGNQSAISDEGNSTGSAELVSPNGIMLPVEHAVEGGENLWGIADKYYGDGEKWNTIAAENELSQTGEVNEGQTLTIPALKAPGSDPSSHVVVSGDSLWDIAVATYGDGYRWTDIYQANAGSIANPDLIYVGQVLVIPQ